VISLPDKPNSNIMHFFPQGIKFITDSLAESPDNKVLVHCFAGKSRSTTMVLAYLMEAQGMTLLEAYTLVKEKRPIVLPNMGFMVQLTALEKKLFGKLSNLALRK
jgi:protein-tyrosine phosphatase